ncbi:MAG: Limonene hydroxylase [Syntrophomonadaceae bacterium]|nr:Limonene hydroxylase [Bacillota bacterium]
MMASLELSVCFDELQDFRRWNKELEIIFESSYDGIILSDEKGRIFRANKSVERVSGGIKPASIIGKTAKQLEKEGIILSQTKKILGTDPLTLTQKLCTGVELFITSTRAFDDNGNFMFHVATLRDMTELNRLKREVEETRNLSAHYQQELIQLRDRVLQAEQVIVRSDLMRQVCERALKVARTDTNVLLTGPSGSGKEVVAKMIHKVSIRKKSAFVQINCGAIPETLLESELFGYNRGAFTGANKQGKIGLMEMANNGTILLDEIADLPLALQVKLLRAIQERVIYRVGSTSPTQLNVRIIAATNKNLEEMVAEGTFREDLYYRLNVIPIFVPPLKDRREDVLPMAFHFLERYNKKHETYKSFSLEVCELLEEYDWPGNVRELENLVERMVVISDSKILTVQCLPNYIQAKCLQSFTVNENTIMEGNKIIPLKQVRDSVEREAIKNALKNCGSIRNAAKLLGVDHSTIVRKMKQLAIKQP